MKSNTGLKIETQRIEAHVFQLENLRYSFFIDEVSIMQVKAKITHDCIFLIMSVFHVNAPVKIYLQFATFRRGRVNCGSLRVSLSMFSNGTNEQKSL